MEQTTETSILRLIRPIAFAASFVLVILVFCCRGDNPFMLYFDLYGTMDKLIAFFGVGALGCCILLLLVPSESFRARVVWTALSTVACLTGLACALLANPLDAAMSATACGILLGFGTIGLIGQWCCVFAQMPQRSIPFIIAISFFFATLLWFILQSVNSFSVTCVALMVFALCGGLLLALTFPIQRTIDQKHQEKIPVETPRGTSFEIPLEQAPRQEAGWATGQAPATDRTTSNAAGQTLAADQTTSRTAGYAASQADSRAASRATNNEKSLEATRATSELPHDHNDREEAFESTLRGADGDASGGADGDASGGADGDAATSTTPALSAQDSLSDAAKFVRVRPALTLLDSFTMKTSTSVSWAHAFEALGAIVVSFFILGVLYWPDATDIVQTNALLKPLGYALASIVVFAVSARGAMSSLASGGMDRIRRAVVIIATLLALISTLLLPSFDAEFHMALRLINNFSLAVLMLFGFITSFIHILRHDPAPTFACAIVIMCAGVGLSLGMATFIMLGSGAYVVGALVAVVFLAVLFVFTVFENNPSKSSGKSPAGKNVS